MLKIQSKVKGEPWILATRAGQLPNAWHVLAAFRCDYPSEEHRLVEVSDTGEITVIPDDSNALEHADELRRIDADKPDPLAHLEQSKLEDIIGKTIIDVQQHGEGVEITFSDNSICQFLLTDDKEFMFVTGGNS